MSSVRNKHDSALEEDVLTIYSCYVILWNNVRNAENFSRAFDNIHRPSKWSLLKLYGIPDKFVALIKSLFKNSESCVRVEQEQTDCYEITPGVRQGDVLSPLLINITIDYTMEKLQQVEGDL